MVAIFTIFSTLKENPCYFIRIFAQHWWIFAIFANECHFWTYLPFSRKYGMIFPYYSLISSPYITALWISINRLRPRLSAHFINQTISRSGLRKCEELPAKIMFFDLWKSQSSASWNSLVTDLLCRTPPVLFVGTNVFQMWRLLAGKICIQ